MPLGALDPEAVVTPGLFVKRIVKVARVAHSSAGGFKQDGVSMARWRTMDAATRWRSRVAHDIPDGAVVNLGHRLADAGRATTCRTAARSSCTARTASSAWGRRRPQGEEDYDLINAGKQPVTLLPGGCFFHHADSFAMMRGGHLDVCVLGAFQVSAAGDLANWHTGAPDAIPAVGGAMDLAIGAKKTFVMMEHTDQERVRARSSSDARYPLTGIGCVSRIYTDLAVIDVTPAGPAGRRQRRRA